VKLIDFGLSDSDSFTILKLPAGTSGYIAPEQLLQGAKSDPQADIYSLGMVLLDMAKATHDRHLRQMAEVCISRDLSIRPKSIREVREHKHESPLLKAGGIVLGIIALLLISLIAFTYYHRAQLKEKQNVPTETGQNAVGAPSDGYLRTLLQIAAYQLACLEERGVVAGTGLQPLLELHVVLVPNILRKNIERHHAWLVVVTHITVEALQG
jgi:serine/threonine protein kinase